MMNNSSSSSVGTVARGILLKVKAAISNTLGSVFTPKPVIYDYTTELGQINYQADDFQVRA